MLRLRVCPSPGIVHFSASLALLAAILLMTAGLPSIALGQEDAPDSALDPAAVAASTESETAPVDGADASETGEASEASATADEEGRARIFEGTLSFTAMGLHIRTRVDQRQSYYGPALELNGFLGPRWGFLANLAMFFPMRAREVGGAGNVRKTYDRNLGFDMILGAGVHRELLDGLTITMGPGVHMNTLDLNDPDLVRINSITMGVGGVASALWTFHNALVLGANGKLAMDFIDLIHDSGELSVGFVWSVGVTAGLQFD